MYFVSFSEISILKQVKLRENIWPVLENSFFVHFYQLLKHFLLCLILMFSPLLNNFNRLQ